MSNLSELSEHFEQVQARMVEEATAAVQVELEKIFEAHPELTAIRWTQYTPYFNDGDECVFGVNGFWATNAPNLDEVSSYGDYEGDDDNIFAVECYGNYGQGKEKYPDIVALREFADSEIGSLVFRQAFGDHVYVTATRDGVDVEEYDHE